MQPKFSTEKLFLDLITEDDYNFILSLVNSPGWLQFIGDRNVHLREEAVNYIKKIRNTPDFFYWVVRLKSGREPIGIISFLKRSYLEHFDIGFAFLPQFSGQGYAYEAAREVLATAGNSHQYSPILATTVPENIRSIKLLTKLGLHFEKEIEFENKKLLIYSTE